MMKLEGRVWKFGDNLRSTDFLSARYDALVRADRFDELATHVLEDTQPDFVRRVRQGDILVVGYGFGTGKHLEGLIGAFKALKLGGVIARSLSAAWERETINLGFPGVVCDGLYDRVETGDLLEIDLSATVATNVSKGETFAVSPTPRGIIEILECGGLEGHTLRQLGRRGPA